MQLKVYNTLTRKKEDFVPINDREVRMYSCGPTVYKYAHIGNLRAYVFMDELRRVLEYDGYKVKSVMNITDVGHLVSDADDGEDKMTKSAVETGRTPLEIADFYTAQFMKDIDALNIKRPTVCPKATDNIGEMIAVVKSLLEKGYAYETEDGIYFSVEKFPEYGKLSGISLDDQRHGARVEVNSFKRHPADFAQFRPPRRLRHHRCGWQGNRRPLRLLFIGKLRFCGEQRRDSSFKKRLCKQPQMWARFGSPPCNKRNRCG